MKASRIIVTLLAALLALATTANAQDSRLDDLRKAGAIGERYDGMAVVRPANADATVKALVDQVNAKRKAIYEENAKKQGAPAQEVGKVYAQQIAGKAPGGTWFLGEDGKWVQKK